MTPENDHRPSLLTRRGVLRLLALTGASLAAGSETSHAFMDFFSSYQPASRGLLAKLDLPSSWIPQLGSQLSNYADFLERMKFRQMSIRQVIAPHAKSHGTVRNTLPPRYLWRNIRSTLKVVDQLADRLDMPVEEIVSVYRTPAYNARCPGAKSNSYHVRNNAMDVVFKCPPGKVAAMARAMRSTGLFKGGVGRYGSFTHIDTRGTNADW
jgi:Peptidase M15